jgi:hypothetical protein
MHQTDTVDCYDIATATTCTILDYPMSENAVATYKDNKACPNNSTCNLFGRRQADGVGLEVVDGVIASKERIA